MNEKGFELQIFQNALSTMTMYPLRLYKNYSFARFQKLLAAHPQMQKELCDLAGTDLCEDAILLLQQKLKADPRNYYQPLAEILEPLSEEMGGILWTTKASNSLVFTREVKSSRTLWVLLMFYDLLPEAYIETQFKTPYLRRCLIDMNTVCVRLDDTHTVTIGRFFSLQQDVSGIVRTIVEDYEMHNSDIFELTKLANVRKFFESEDVLDEALSIRNAYRLFFTLLEQLPDDISKDALEKIAVFIFMIVKEGVSGASIVLEGRLLRYAEGVFSFQGDLSRSDPSESDFADYYKRYIRYRTIFQSEYTSRLKSMLAKKYTGFSEEDEFSPVHEVIKRISSALYADGACYIKYHLSRQTFRMPAAYGDAAYKEGIGSFIRRINRQEGDAVKKSRVVKIVRNYFSEQNHNDISKLILLNLKEDEMLQPVEGKMIRSNIAIPVTFKHKLLGILLIDSYRPNAFKQDDINLVLSISNALSIQIYDEIIEKNLFNIIRNVPSQTQLDDQKSIDAISANLTKYINSIFFSIGVDIWSYQEHQFRRISSTIQNGAGAKMIIHKDEPEFICQLLRGKADPLVEPDIRHASSFVSCKPHLLDSRINAVRIYGIYHEDGTLAGALSVYNRTCDDYLSIDSRSLRSVRDYLRIFFSMVHTFRKRKEIVHSNSLHDINQNLIMIDEKTRQLKEMLFFHFKELDRYTRYRFGIKLKDINEMVRNLKSKFDYISGKGERYLCSNDTDRLIEEEYTRLQKQFNGETRLLDVLHRVVNSIHYRHKNLRFKLDVDDLRLKIAPAILEDIFVNIVQNAVKYSYQNTYISIRTVKLKHSLLIFIENIGIGIHEDEFDDIFEYAYRGFNALEFEEEIGDEVVSYPRGEIENAGYGLYKCRKLIKLFSGGIRLEDSVSVGKGHKNIFRITLPMTLVNQKKVLKNLEKELTEKFKGFS